MITNFIQLDFNKENDLKVPSVQYDSGSRFVKIKLQQNKVPFEINGYRVTVVANKVDGTEIMNDCTILDGVNGIVQFEITEQFNAVEGVVDCQLKLFKGKTLLTSMPFSINVVKSVSTKEIVSSNELKTLVNALGEVQNIDNRFAQTNAQLSELANKGTTVEVLERVTKEEINRQIADGTMANLTIADNSITGEKIAKLSIESQHIKNNAISIDKTDFGSVGKNLFNKEKVSPKGWWINTVNGKPESNQYVTEYCYSDLIKVQSGQYYKPSHYCHSITNYDVNEVFISGTTDSSSINNGYLVPVGTEYVRITTRHDQIEKLQFEKGQTTTTFEPYGVNILGVDINGVKEQISDTNERINEIDGTLHSSFDYKEEYTDIIMNEGGSEQYTSSTFSGWGTLIGKPEHIASVTFKVKARTEPITSIRVDLLIDNPSGESIHSETLSVNIASNTEQEVTFELKKPFTNTNNDYIWFAYRCNQLCNTFAKYAKIPETEDNKYLARYSTNGSMGDPLSMNKIHTTEIASATYCTTVKITGIKKYFDISKQVAGITEQIDTLSENVNLLNDPVNQVIETGYDFIKTGQSGALEGETFTSSTFSGWGGYIGTFNRVEAIRFGVKNRDVDTMKKVRCFITKFNKSGEILAKVDLDVKINPNEMQYLYWVLDKPILNESGEQLYFSYCCDKLVTKIFTTLPSTETDDVNYGKNTYCVNGTIHETPSTFSNVHSSLASGATGNNGVWVEVGQAEFKYTLKERVMNDVVAHLKNEQENISANTCRIVLPDKVIAVVGDKLQLYYRGLIEAVNPYNYDIRVTCSKGSAYPRYFEFKPTSSDIGAYPLKIQVFDNDKKLMAEDTTILEVVNVNNAPSSNKNILCIGDSLTSGGIWVREAHRRLSETGGTPSGHGFGNITFIGSKKNGSTGFEGYGGWTWDSYLAKPNTTTSDIWVSCSHDKTSEDQHSIWVDVNGSKWSLETIESNRLKFTRYEQHTNNPPANGTTLTHSANAVHKDNIKCVSVSIADGNPFWDLETERVNFKAYCKRHGFSGIDYVYTLLTWNGGRVDKATVEDNASVIRSAKRLIDIIHRDYPNAKIRVLGIQLPSLNGGTGANYGANGNYSYTYGLVRGVFGLNLAYQEFANEDEYKDFVEFVNVSGQFDSEYNMPQALVPVNTRSSLTEYRGHNGVHPSNEGYLQIGDVAYRKLVQDLLK